MTAWRSWFWNIFLAVCLFLMAAASTATAFSRTGQSHNALTLAVWVPISVVLWIGYVRSLTLGVRADSEGVVVRLLLRTVKIQWSEIEKISGSGGSAGATGHAVAPTITWNRSGKSVTTNLNVLGSYRYFSDKKPLGELAAEELNTRLVRWQHRNGKSRSK
jgi:hypothetical protein